MYCVFATDFHEPEPLFKRRSFVILGFDADEEAFKLLSELITENGGNVMCL
jgi:hypothetical protein